MTQTITRRDGVAEGLAIKRPVACATTANITLSAEQTIDGVTTSGSRVLVKNQTDTTQNGIYVSGTGAWVRSLDFDGSTDFTTGTMVEVSGGTTNANTLFLCTVSADPPVVGTSTITWAAQNASIANASLTNAKLANSAANTFKGNPTTSSAAPSDFTIDGLTVKATPAGADEFIIWDVAGAALKKATVTSIQGGSNVTSFNGATGAITFVSPPQGRLTLATGVPVMTSTQSAKTTVFYTPYQGQFVPIYNGTNFIMTDTGGELSQATTDTTKSPAAVGASSVYDIFVWNDSGTIRATRGPAWTNDTTRSAGTALVMQNGIWLNNATITNGPAASRGTYVGTIRSNASSQIDWILGGLAAGGSAGWFGLWNAYNRINVQTQVRDSVDSFTVSGNTIGTYNGNNNRVSFVVGLQEDFYEAEMISGMGSSAFSDGGSVAIGYNSTAVISGTNFGCNQTGTNTTSARDAEQSFGFNYFQALANHVGNAATVTFYGDNAAPTYQQSGLTYRGRH